jgi:hypothetical protein
MLMVRKLMARPGVFRDGAHRIPTRTGRVGEP